MNQRISRFMAGLVSWLFILWLGPEHPFYVVPVRWWSLGHWRMCRRLTRISTWDWEHGGKENAERQVLSVFKEGRGVPRVPWTH